MMSNSIKSPLPNSLEGEQGVLGCILLSPMLCMSECADLIRSEMFYDVRNQLIYQACEHFFHDGIAFDMVLLNKRLTEIQSNVPLAYLATLPDMSPSAANLPYYVDIVLEKYHLRSILGICGQGTAMVREFVDGQAPLEIADRIAAMCFKLRDGGRVGTPPFDQVMVRTEERIEAYRKAEGKISGLSTGFPELDKMTWGLQNGDLIIIAGRPSTGKTALAMQMAEHVAADKSLPVGVFSLEMTADSLGMRMVCSRAGVNIRYLREGQLEEQNYSQLKSVVGGLKPAPIYLDDQAGLTISQVQARARRMALHHGIKLLVVDYLQLLSSERRGQGNRQQEIADISSGLKRLAKDLNIPVVALSQLNRELDKEKGRAPRLSDLRESGTIEQDADLVGMLHKPTNPNDDPTKVEGDAIDVNLNVVKQRNGPTGCVRLVFSRSITRFGPKPKIDSADVPTVKEYPRDYESN